MRSGEMGGTAKGGILVFLTVVAAHLTTPSRASAMPAPSPAPRAATITAASLAKASAVVDEASAMDPTPTTIKPPTPPPPPSGPAIITAPPANVSAYLNDRVELKCGVKGDSGVKVSWRSRDLGEMPRVGHHYRVHKNGSLIFRFVNKRDEGWYGCEAEDVDGNVAKSEFVRLLVEAKVKIVEHPDVIHREFGEAVDLQCTATGDPPPLISWMKGGRPLPIYHWKSEIKKGVEYAPFSYYSRSVLRINVTETANYTCYAINQMVTRQSYDQSSFMVYLKEEEKAREEDLNSDYSKGYCAPYNGQVCRNYLKGRGLVWFNVSQDNSGGWLNEQIAQKLWSEIIEKLEEPCRSAAESLLCKYAFPDCTLNDGNAVGLPICHEDCVALQSHFCFNDWATIEDNKRRGILVANRGHFRLPKCEKLPKYDNATKVCTKSSVTSMSYDLSTTSCVKGNGRFYQGQRNVTKDGLECQRWFTADPHPQTIPEGVFPEMATAADFCRNPGGTEPIPWCYTLDPGVRWQYCDIPLCDNATAVAPGSGGAVGGRDGAGSLNDYILEFEMFGGSDVFQELLSPTFIALTASVTVALIFVLILVGLICNKACCGRSKPGPGYAVPAEQSNAPIDLDKLPENQSYHRTGAALNPKLEKLEYPRNDIIYLRDIGQGAFGRVFQGKAPGLAAGEEFSMVAVKMLKEDATDNLQSDFEKEASILAEFDHPNIVKLLGVCAVGKPMCLLFEFMAKGDLNTYLRSNSPNGYMTRNGSTASGSQFSGGGNLRITGIEQANISKQICNGLVYLSDRKFVHRDLASRNCLLDNFGAVKIADFGLSQKIYLQDYYRGDETDAIPIRWMPLESILQNKYTAESDVWAFGVLLWEIFSFALQPYYGLSHEEVVKYLKEGKVLQCPDNTPKSVYRVMISCWRPQASSRPSFRTLYREMETIEKELVLIRRHFKSQKSVMSEGDRLASTPQLLQPPQPPPHSPAKSLGGI